MSNEVTTRQSPHSWLAHRYGLDEADVRLIHTTVAKGASVAELGMFLYQCRRTQLDPLSRQAYWIRGFQVSIDGERLIAQRSGEYRGQTPAQWCGKDGQWVEVWLSNEPPVAARVGVYREGFREPVYAVAKFSSYVQPSPTWKKMPEMMLAKCSESLALRKAFPNELSGVYAPEELGGESEATPLMPNGEEPRADEACAEQTEAVQ